MTAWLVFLSHKNAIENVHERKEFEKFRLMKKMLSAKKSLNYKIICELKWNTELEILARGILNMKILKFDWIVDFNDCY